MSYTSNNPLGTFNVSTHPQIWNYLSR